MPASSLALPKAHGRRRRLPRPPKLTPSQIVELLCLAFAAVVMTAMWRVEEKQSFLVAACAAVSGMQIPVLQAMRRPAAHAAILTSALFAVAGVMLMVGL